MIVPDGSGGGPNSPSRSKSSSPSPSPPPPTFAQSFISHFSFAGSPSSSTRSTSLSRGPSPPSHLRSAAHLPQRTVLTREECQLMKEEEAKRCSQYDDNDVPRSSTRLSPSVDPPRSSPSPPLPRNRPHTVSPRLALRSHLRNDSYPPPSHPSSSASDEEPKVVHKTKASPNAGKRSRNPRRSDSERTQRPPKRRRAVDAPLKVDVRTKVRKPPRGYADPMFYRDMGYGGVVDHIDYGLDVIWCGINPGLKSSSAGHHFAGPSNHFWKALHLSGFTPTRYPPTDDHLLLRLSPIRQGLTNLVGRPSAEDSELLPAEKRAEVPRLLEKLRRYRPRLMCVVGRSIWDSIVHSIGKDLLEWRRLDGSAVRLKEGEKMPKFAFGLQPHCLVHPSFPAVEREEEGNLDDQGGDDRDGKRQRDDGRGHRVTYFWVVPSTSGRVTSHNLPDKAALFRGCRVFVERLQELYPVPPRCPPSAVHPKFPLRMPKTEPDGIDVHLPAVGTTSSPSSSTPSKKAMPGRMSASRHSQMASYLAYMSDARVEGLPLSSADDGGENWGLSRKLFRVIDADAVLARREQLVETAKKAREKILAGKVKGEIEAGTEARGGEGREEKGASVAAQHLSAAEAEDDDGKVKTEIEREGLGED